MKYFTPELLARCRSLDDDVADAAAEEWERAIVAYKARFQAIRSRLPVAARRLVDRVTLHDAKVLGFSLGEKKPRFTILLRLEGPRSSPFEVVELNYHPVAGEHGGVSIRKHGLQGKGDQNKGWVLYDELNLDDDHAFFTHSLLLTDGHEVEVRFHSLRVRFVEGVVTPFELAEEERHWPLVEA